MSQMLLLTFLPCTSKFPFDSNKDNHFNNNCFKNRNELNSALQKTHPFKIVILPLYFHIYQLMLPFIQPQNTSKHLTVKPSCLSSY